MDRNKKKGQASMEFLMTYGWAILAAVLAVGALAYYGVFNPGSSLPDACTINGLVSCDESVVNGTGVYLILRNGAGSSITLNSVTVGDCTVATPAASISDSDTYGIQLTGCSQGSADAKYSGSIELDYTLAGKTISTQAKGDIRGTVR